MEKSSVGKEAAAHTTNRESRMGSVAEFLRLSVVSPRLPGRWKQEIGRIPMLRSVVGAIGFCLACMAIAEGQLWVRSRGSAHGFAMAMDSVGRVCIAGPSRGIPEDIVAVKYGTDGTRLWETVYDTPEHGREYCYDVAIDALGNSYITGHTDQPRHRFMLTLKLDSLGNVRWVSRYITPDSGACRGVALALDGRGKLYIAGETSGNDYDITVFRFDTSGTIDWTSSYNGPLDDSDRPWDIVVDGHRNVYVCGVSDGVIGRQDCVTLKFDSAGTQKWVQRYDGPGHDNDQALQVRLDSRNNVIVVGESDGGSTEGDWVTIKYNSAGQELWVRRFDWIAHSHDGAYGLAIDGNDNILVCGCIWYNSGGQDRDFAVVKYSPSGESLWTTVFGLHSGIAEPRRITADGQGRSYISGLCSTPDDSSGWLTAQLDSGGQVLWGHFHGRRPFDLGAPHGVLLDDSGCIYVGGTSYGAQTVIKYPNPSVGIEAESQVTMPAAVVRPNPSRGCFNLCIPANGGRAVEIRDIAGRLVTKAVTDASGHASWNSRRQTGEVLPSGVYHACWQDAHGKTYQTRLCLLR